MAQSPRPSPGRTASPRRPPRRYAVTAVTAVAVLAATAIVALAFSLTDQRIGGHPHAAAETAPATDATDTARPDASEPAGPTTEPGAPGTPDSDRAPRSTSGPCRYTETEDLLALPQTVDAGLPPDPKPTPSTGATTVTLKTSVGDIVITLDRGAAPCAVQSLTYLAGQRFYDGTRCHRLTTSGIFVLQCGDPSGTGSGGATYQFRDENLPSARYGAGVVAMANSGPDTNGSQFFILYRDSDAALSKNYSVVGRVSAGLDAVRRVAAAGADDSNGPGDGHPNIPVLIRSVTR